MKKILWAKAMVLVVLGAAAGAHLGAQSLGEIARKARAQKETAPKAKPNRVFTEDTIPRDTTLASAKPAPAAESKEGGADKSKEPRKSDSAEEEKSWRARFAKLREELSYEARKLDVLQRELNLAQIQNYSDPNQALREQFQRTEINKRTQEIEQQKQAVDRLKKAIADLEEELRRKGLPSGWAQ